MLGDDEYNGQKWTKCPPSRSDGEIIRGKKACREHYILYMRDLKTVEWMIVALKGYIEHGNNIDELVDYLVQAEEILEGAMVKVNHLMEMDRDDALYLDGEVPSLAINVMKGLIADVIGTA